MKIYLAAWQGKRNEIVEDIERMKIYLAGIAPWAETGMYDKAIIEHKPYILDSFFYINKDTTNNLKYFGDFLLDSGAFTFMQGKGGKIDWNEYADRYAQFILEHKIKKYFELDIDSIVGYENVLKLRERIEKQVGYPSIPVWHENRGKEDFIQMCKKYPYVAIGSADNRKAQYMPWFIDVAHKNEAKIHGLGFTALTQLARCHFDSVDSTAWTTGNRFGHVYKFKNGQMTKIDVPKGKRMGDTKAIALNNYIEWIKFQKYAEVHL